MNRRHNRAQYLEKVEKLTREDIEKEDIKPVFLRLDSELADKSKK